MFQSWVAFNGGRQEIGGLGLESSSARRLNERFLF